MMRLTAVLSFITMLAIASAFWLWHGKTEAQAAEQKAIQDLNISASTMSNALRLTTVFSVISEGRAHEKLREQQEGEQRRKDNQQDLRTVPCASEYLPESVERRLFNNASRLRASYLSEDTSGVIKPDTNPLPANDR